MRVRDIVTALSLEIIHEGEHLDDPVEGGYVGDLLSDVIASARRRDFWITIQSHENIIAVATLKDLAGVVLAKNTTPHAETVEHAKRENVTLLRSSMTSYQLVARLAGLGISGDR
ncbi:MAG: DRTGG domain-containing protein [Candidatus Eisenbacteria bacterium]|jgi:serine kinase of HPr protein (carbohydrate metabolism regulator)|nr:DRTGG domain-containing protein [Candidatus Eisenbacteria bacterium]